MGQEAGVVTSDVSVRGKDGAAIPCYLAEPPGVGHPAGVVIAPELFGLSEWIRSCARRLAEFGFRAIAVEGCSGGESDTAIILLENVTVSNGSDFSHKNVELALTKFGLMNYDDRGKNNFARPVGVALAKSNTTLTSILSLRERRT